MDAGFKIDRDELVASGRVVLGEWAAPLLDDLSNSIEMLRRQGGSLPTQHGRVIALRYTDCNRAFSSFKAALYHSNYDDMLDGARFIERIAPRGHSLEAIRGETVLFLFVGVSRVVYEALTMFTSGRPTRICGGFHHSVPWGLETPLLVDDADAFAADGMRRVSRVVDLEQALVACGEDETQKRDDLQKALEAARNALPISYLMAPFALEFSVEALVTKVFAQRLWERGANERETYSVVDDMWQVCCAYDEELFESLKALQARSLGSLPDTLR